MAQPRLIPRGIYMLCAKIGCCLLWPSAACVESQAWGITRPFACTLRSKHVSGLMMGRSCTLNGCALDGIMQEETVDCFKVRF
jgi:hypothetical protein